MIFVPGRWLNSVPLAKHFHSAEPVSEKLAVNPEVNRRPPGLRPILRLSFGALTPKEDRSIPDLFNLIARGPLNSRWIFPDTNFITNPMHPRLWALGRGRRIAFSRMTIAELSGWFSYPMHNAYLQSWLPRAVQRCLAEPISEGGASGLQTCWGRLVVSWCPFRWPSPTRVASNDLVTTTT